jgi:antitoxin (DNA-binding transcriptional repressor) of toxin-antitoxin stability system
MGPVEHRISATELARTLGDVLARVRYRGDTFVVERNGDPVARVSPVVEGSPTSLREAFAAWRAAGPPDPELADALELVNRLDQPPDDPWAS